MNSQGFTTGDSGAQNRILIVHGYTGSPDSFHELAEKLSTELDAYVSVPLLPGHGTTIADLDSLTFPEFLGAARSAYAELSTPGSRTAIVGYCFGGYLAAIIAAENNPAAVVIGLTSYPARFPFNVPGVAHLLNMRASWDKYLYPDEIEMRKPFFYYPRMPGRGQMLINESIERIKVVLPKLGMPLMTMHTTEDPTVSIQSGENILAASGQNPANESHLLSNRRHALFFGPHTDEDIQIVADFLKKNLK